MSGGSGPGSTPRPNAGPEEPPADPAADPAADPVADPVAGSERASELTPLVASSGGGGGGDDGSRTASQAGWLVWGNALSTLASAIVPFVILRLLGKGEVASLAAVILAYETLSLFLTAGFPQTLMYHLAGKAGGERRAVTRRVVGLLMLLGAGAGALLAGVALAGSKGGVLASEGYDLAPLLLLAPVAIVELPVRLLPTILVVEQRTKLVPLFGVLRSASASLAVLIPVALGANVWVIVLCKAVADAVYALCVLGVLRRLYAKFEVATCSVSVRELFRFAVPLGATDAVAMLNQQLDRYLILFSFPAAAFAGYHAAAWQIPVITSVPYAVGTAYQPRLVELFRAGKGHAALELWRAGTRKVSLIVVPVVMVFIVGAEQAMWLLGGEPYVEAANVFRAYSFLTLARVTTFGSVIVAAGRPRLVLAASLVTLLSNVLLSVPLLIAVGFLGPAIGTALAFIPTALVYCYFIAQAANQPLRFTFPLVHYLKVVLVAAIAALPALALKQSAELSQPVLFGLVAVIELVGFALLASVLGLIKREDWRYLHNWSRGKLAQ